jgi:DNA-binding NarL/FixJ family response regulator
VAPSLARAPLCPTIIGREPYLAELRRALEAARDRRGQAVLLSGEAGIGKSRLVREVAARADEIGLHVAQGTCFEPDRQLPYAPLIELLRALLAAWPPDQVAAALAEPVVAPLARLLPELGPRLPAGAAAAPASPAQERRHVFQALVGLLTRLAAIRPLLLVVEDVHWSDEASLEALTYLARRLRGEPMLLLLTYRSDEVLPALSHALAELERERLASELRLAPLSSAELLAMLRAIFDLPQSIHPELGEAIYDLTEGNPFFVEEVLGSLVAAGDIFYAAGRWNRKPLDELRIPRTIQDAVRRRAARLSQPARRTLALAAVAGRRFDFGLLQALTGAAESDLLAQLRELIDAQLVVEVDNTTDQFAFRHALTRQAISAELLGRERRALHRRVAEALEQLRAGPAAEPPLEDLAAHYAAAGVWDKALTYAQRAGERAQALHVPRAAVDQFSRALEAAERLGIEPAAALHQARGQAHELLGHFEAARADYERALARAEAAGQRTAEWQARVALGLLWAGRDYAQAADHYQRALQLARRTGDPTLIARSLTRLGNWHQNAGQPAEALAHHQEALAVFRAAGDRQGIAETLDLLGTATSIAGDLPAARAHYEQAAALFRELRQPQGLSSAQAMLSVLGGSYFHDTVPVADLGLADALRHHEEALRAARAIDWRAGEAFALVTIGVALGPRGDHGRALAALRAGLAIAEEIEHRQWTTCAHVGFGALHLDLLDLAAARRHLEHGLRLAQDIRSRHWIDQATGLLVSVHAAAGDTATGAAVLAEALDPACPPRTRPQRAVWCAAVELALARGEPAGALDLLERLSAVTPNASAERVVPRLARLRAEALRALGRLAEAEVALQAARQAAVAQGARGLLWRVDVLLARLHRARGDRHAAEQAAAAARALVGELAGALPEPPLRDTFLGAALRQLPAAPPLSPRRATKLAFGGLTEREREVAALIARGRTNRQIADELVITEHTAERHVENILGKLGLTSRVQIAAWAMDKGLLSPTR